MAVGNTAIWRVRISGANANGGGYDPGIGGAATDYSQQNAAQATGTNGAGSATTTFTDATAANFTSAMVGNAINISGQGFYFVTAFTSATQVVVDRALGTFSGASWRLGGGWADFVTNTTSSGPLVPGNTVFILGSGTPAPPYGGGYDYTVSAHVTTTAGDTTNGFITFAADPLTPGYKAPPDTTGGMPLIQVPNGDQIWNSTSYFKLSGLWCVGNVSLAGVIYGSDHYLVYGCVFDQNGLDGTFDNTPSTRTYIGCELFNSGGGAAGTQYALGSGQFNVVDTVIGCNIHDIRGGGIANVTGGVISGNIIAKCGIDGLHIGHSDTMPVFVTNNTVDGNGGNGITIDQSGSPVPLVYAIITNNIFSNHTGVSKAGLAIINGGTAAQSTRLAMLVDYNSFYNNTSNYSGINAGPHDTALGVTPYVASGTENYTLA